MWGTNSDWAELLGMKTVDKGYGQFTSMYTQTPAEMILIRLSGSFGDVSHLIVVALREGEVPINLEITKLAMPTQRGLICHAHVQ